MADLHVLSPDTQAILLLCGRFGRQEDANTPLTLSEYNQLAQWLHERAMRPADLLDEGWQGKAENSGFPLSIERMAALLRRGAAMAFAVESWTSKGLWVLSRSDDSYPHLLKSRLGRQAPPILYGAGDVALTSQGGLAIVGSRHTDDETLAFVRLVAQACASQGVQIVSGGARGVDSEAMTAALDAGGTAVGVLADSLAKHAVSRRYRQALLSGRLALLSATDPAAGFSAGNAMGRNKYIYALATWSLVASASLGTGGTWAGAVEELKAGRTPVYVRMQDDAPPAHHKLVELGARAFPDEPWANLANLLSSPADTVRSVAPADQGYRQEPLLPLEPPDSPAPSRVADDSMWE
jgi:predicted Rossmann fold nucleotide-binding protein DprA/Smf involved in DNA uptake